MKEEYIIGDKTIVKLSRAEITRIANGEILRGYRVDVGMEEKT